MGFLDEIKWSGAANRQIAKKSKAAYFQAKQEQSIRVARERAKIEADRKIKSMSVSGGGGFLNTLYGPGGLMGMPQRTAAPVRRHRTKHRATPKTRTRVVYVQGPPPRSNRYW